MSDLTIPTFLKRKKPSETRTIDTPLSNIASTPQAPEKAPKVTTRFKKQPKPKSSKPRIIVKDGKPVKPSTPETIRREVVAKLKAETKAKPAKAVKIKLPTDVLESAKAGHLPVPPEVTEKSSTAYKKHRSDLIALAKAKDVKGLREYRDKMNPDRVKLHIYLEGCLIALDH